MPNDKASKDLSRTSVKHIRYFNLYGILKLTSSDRNTDGNFLQSERPLALITGRGKCSTYGNGLHVTWPNKPNVALALSTKPHTIARYYVSNFCEPGSCTTEMYVPLGVRDSIAQSIQIERLEVVLRSDDSFIYSQRNASISLISTYQGVPLST
jgi:hypothetical protein